MNKVLIETERLILREITFEDFDAWYEILSDAETMQHYPAPFDEEKVRSWINWNLDNYQKYGFGLWAIVLKETGEFIGDCGITLQDIDGDILPEIGYHINKKYWHRGFAKEAARAVRDWVFETTSYNIIYSYMKYTNVGSYSTAIANGMKKVKEYLDPKNTISHVYAITKDEWKTIISGGNKMDFLTLAKERYSVRKFKDEPISDEHMARILEACNVAPTGCNYQPQRIYVVKSEEALAKINQASKCIFGAKTVLIFAYNKEEDWKNRLEEGVHSGVQDVSIVATHAMMEAWECGVGSCWVNFFSPTKLHEIMGLPDNEEVVCIMPIGYPADDAAPMENMHSVYKDISETVSEI